MTKSGGVDHQVIGDVKSWWLLSDTLILHSQFNIHQMPSQHSNKKQKQNVCGVTNSVIWCRLEQMEKYVGFFMAHNLYS